MKKITRTIPVALAVSTALGSTAMAQTLTLSEIRMYPYPNGCPVHTAKTDGQPLAPASNPALFSLIGCTYGGDCTTSFKLPDARGRTLVDDGTNSFSTYYPRGHIFGEEITDEVPRHTHGSYAGHNGIVYGSLSDGDSHAPAGNLLATVTVVEVYKTGTPSSTGAMHADTIDNPAGSVASVTNMQPSSVINYCIVTDGYYPTRN